MTLPTDRWDKNRQRIKVSGSLHRDERTFLMGLNKRIEHHVKAIQDAVDGEKFHVWRVPVSAKNALHGDSHLGLDGITDGPIDGGVVANGFDRATLTVNNDETSA